MADDSYRPSYGRAELRDALTYERNAASAAEQRVRELAERGDDQFASARADLGVRRRFAASLEACVASGAMCPPRLDEAVWSYDVTAAADPMLDTKLRFDLDTWRKIADELHGRACACRTIACIDSMFGAIERLEPRPMPDTQADELASLAITRARECLYRLRGRRATPRALATE